MHPLATYYDLQIAILLVASGAVCFLLTRDRLRRPKSWAASRPRPARIVALLAGLVFATVSYGSFIEPRLITVSDVPIALAGDRVLSSPIKIALISDFHAGPYKKEKWIQRVIRDLKRLAPDAVLIAGDFVYTDDGTDELDHLAPIAELAKKIPTIAVLGNHDTGLGDEYYFIERPDGAEKIIKTLTAAGVTVLQNEQVILESGPRRIAVAGLAEFRTGRSNHLNALRGIPPEVPRIVLSHNPGNIRLLDPRSVDLVLAAHTHGGQVRLPLLPPLVRIPTPLGQRFDHGLFYVNGLPLFITRGIGESGPRTRLFAPPEIVILTLQ